MFRSEDAPDPTPPQGASGLAGEKSAHADRSGRLLLVDDESVNRDLLGRQLRRAGYEVSEAESGRAALTMIEEREFDLVLLDVMMPDLDDVQTLELLRSTRSVAELPVIMATALSGTSDMVAALEAGANDYVTKPFDMALVSARIQAQLALRAAAQEIEALAQQLEIQNLFLRRTFGRFLSDEVVTSLLESDGGLEIRGERRRVSILVADLRGFTSLTQALDPDEIVAILNNYLATMADVIQEYEGTVDEFLGYAILAHFGALSTRDDDTERGVGARLRCNWRSRTSTASAANGAFPRSRWASVWRRARSSSGISARRNGLSARRLAAPSTWPLGSRATRWANYDETVFADPLRFDVTRTPNPHVSFGGGGPHFCLGAHLAQLEIRVLLDELILSTCSIALEGPADRLRSSWVNGLKRLPVTIVAAR